MCSSRISLTVSNRFVPVFRLIYFQLTLIRKIRKLLIQQFESFFFLFRTFLGLQNNRSMISFIVQVLENNLAVIKSDVSKRSINLISDSVFFFIARIPFSFISRTIQTVFDQYAGENMQTISPSLKLADKKNILKSLVFGKQFPLFDASGQSTIVSSIVPCNCVNLGFYVFRSCWEIRRRQTGTAQHLNLRLNFFHCFYGISFHTRR